MSAAAAKRARIVLLAADGVANTRIADLVDATVTTVLSWRDRYQTKGLVGLVDAPRSGRPRTLDHRAIVVLRLYLGLSIEESAQTLGIPVGTAKSRLHYALIEMRVQVTGDDTAHDRVPGGQLA